MKNKSFLDECLPDFFDYFETQKVSRLNKKEEYQKALRQMEDIKNKYPNVRNFIENSRIVILTKEELKAVLEIINITKEIETMEIVEAFKLGIKETKII